MPAARLGKTALFPRLVPPLLGKMPVFPRSVPPLTPLPSHPTSPGEDASLSQASTPLTSLPSQPTPPREDASLPQAVHPLPPFPPSLQLSCLHQKTGDLLTSLTPKQVNLTIQQTILGKVAGNPQGKGPPRPPRRFILPPGKAITPPPPPTRHPQGSSKEEPNPKWVINLSNKPLTPAQRSVLAKGPNFVVTPRQPPNLEYITAIEAACTKLSQQDAEELRADINRVLRSSHSVGA